MPNLNKLNVSNKDLTTTSLDRTDFEQDSKTLKIIDNTILVCTNFISITTLTLYIIICFSIIQVLCRAIMIT